MAIYYVDPTNGLNTNDGLTPATAYADFFTGDGGAEDIPTYWIKRGETVAILATKTLDYGNIYAWPKSTDDNYADRPQAGIDASWDNDIQPDPIVLTAPTSITNISVPSLDLSNIHFKGIDFSLLFTSGTLFELKSARITFDKCKIGSENHNFYILKYISGSSAKDLDNGVVTFNDCDIYNNDWSNVASILAYYYSNDDHNYKKELHINDTKISGIGTTVYSIKSGHARYIRAFVNDCDIKNSDYFARTSNAGGSHAQYVYIDINRSSIVAENDIFETSYSTAYCSRSFHLTARDSQFYAGEYIIDDYHSSSNTGHYSRMSKIDLKGCVFKAQRFYNNYAYNKNYMDNINIIDCEFKNMACVFYFYGLQAVNIFNFSNNVLDEVENLIYCSVSYANKCKFNISLKGQSITSNLLDRCSGGEIYLEDCNIGKELCGTTSSGLNIVAVNSNFDAIKGSGHSVSLSSCRMESSSGSALEDVVGEISDSQIISAYERILSPSSSVEFHGCNLDVKGINPPEGGRHAKLTKTVLNGIPEPMLIMTDRVIKQISPVYRVNGNDFSYFIQALPKDYDSRSVTSGIYVKHLNAKPMVTVYFTSVDDITDTDRLTVKASFVSEGILKVVAMDVVIDSSSQWDGVQVENVKYKAVVDLSSYTIIDGSKIKMIISMSNKSLKSSSINVDTKLGQE